MEAPADQLARFTYRELVTCFPAPPPATWRVGLRHIKAKESQSLASVNNAPITPPDCVCLKCQSESFISISEKYPNNTNKGC